MHAIAGDMTVVQCLTFTATFEACIQCGLIQSNMGYTVSSSGSIPQPLPYVPLAKTSSGNFPRFIAQSSKGVKIVMGGASKETFAS